MAAPMNLTDLEKEIIFQRDKCYNLIEFEKVEEIGYSDFFKDYLLANKPCIFAPNVTSHWKSRHDWVLEDHTPNFCFLRSQFGESTVPVANCGQEQFSSHPKQDMVLSEYLDYWEKYRSEGYPANVPCLYLKDWHFTKAHPNYEAYNTPVYFQSDWLNEFWDTLPEDDYRFVYMGPKGTWTPFHADVYRSFSWSANICGKKKWIFYPPGCEEMLKDNLGNLVYDVMSSDLDIEKKFPNAYKVKGQQLEVIQGEGQIIFVPSGWHHQVYNLEDTISINHNWLNGCNIDICWKHLQAGLHDVKKEIDHCRDMDGWNDQCQLILKACAGINYSLFIKMLTVIAENRIKQLEQNHGISSTALASHTDNVNASNEEQQITGNDALELSCQIDKEFSLTKMYHALTEGLNCDAVLIDNHKEKCEGMLKKIETEVLESVVADTINKCETLKFDFNKKKKKTCEKCEKEMDLFENCGKRRCEHGISVCDSSSISEWSERDYLLFDLHRIRQVLQNIISDNDYKKLEIEHNDSAEYILIKIQHYPAICH